MPSVPTTIKNKELVEKRREKLILAAIKLFAKKGYHKTTLKDLAEESGISYGNIYDYVGSKEDIFFLIHEFVNRIAHESLTQNLKNVKDPLEKLRRLIRAELNLLYEWNDAVLLLYRETHVLMNNRNYLNKLLQRERERHEKTEIVLKECIDKGYFPEFNIRLVANLIKIMCETCVLKRWDLKGHATQSEMESHITNLIFHGLLQEKHSTLRHIEDLEAMGGKTALIINGETLLGKNIIPFLLNKGLKLAIYVDGKCRISHTNSSEKVKYYSCEDYGPMSVSLFKDIVADFGPIDIIIQDLGAGINYTHGDDKNLSGEVLEANLHCAQDLAMYLEIEMPKRGSGRILYLAPGAWDKYADPLRYETVKAATASLAQTMAKRMATSRVNVNCIIPGFITGIKPVCIKSNGNAESIQNTRGGRPTDILDFLKLVYFLISEESKCLTGQVLEVEGGTN